VLQVGGHKGRDLEERFGAKTIVGADAELRRRRPVGARPKKLTNTLTQGARLLTDLDDSHYGDERDRGERQQPAHQVGPPRELVVAVGGTLVEQEGAHQDARNHERHSELPHHTPQAARVRVVAKHELYVVEEVVHPVDPGHHQYLNDSNHEG